MLFMALLFAVFFLKYNAVKKASHNTDQGFVIERNEY